MDDAELVRRACDGDQGAWAGIYDAYADRLHDYCHSILRDRHAAADVLHDAFVTGATKIGQLRDPTRLRPWLYAICRTEALAVIRKRSREVPDEDAAAMTAPSFDHDTVAETELRELVADAAGGLEPKERAVLFLHLRGGFEGKELAEALGVTAHHATVMLGRVRDHVERSLSALLVGRTGRAECDELDALLAGWDGALSPLIRKRVARHIDGCETCGDRRKRMVSPLALLGSMPMVPAPTDLREPVLDDIALVCATRKLDVGQWLRHRAGALAAGLLVLALAAGVVAAVEARRVAGEPAAAAGDPSTTVPSSTASSPPPSTTSSKPRPTSIRPSSSTPPSSGKTAASPSAAAPLTSPAGPEAPVSSGTTTTPPARTSPTISGLKTDRAWISPTDPACQRTTASATVVDDNLSEVVFVWQQGSGRQHPVTGEPGAGDVYTATIGPPDPSGPVTWWVIAADDDGNEVTSDVQTLRVADACV